jgi:hypothetical protein
MQTPRTEDVSVTIILSAKHISTFGLSLKLLKKSLCEKAENPTEHQKFPEWQTKHNITKKRYTSDQK